MRGYHNLPDETAAALHRRRLVPHRRHRRARRRRLPEDHRPQEGPDQDLRRQVRRAEPHRGHVQGDLPVHLAGASSSARPATSCTMLVTLDPDAIAGLGRRHARWPGKSYAEIAASPEAARAARGLRQGAQHAAQPLGDDQEVRHPAPRPAIEDGELTPSHEGQAPGGRDDLRRRHREDVRGLAGRGLDPHTLDRGTASGGLRLPGASAGRVRRPAAVGPLRDRGRRSASRSVVGRLGQPAAPPPRRSASGSVNGRRMKRSSVPSTPNRGPGASRTPAPAAARARAVETGASSSTQRHSPPAGTVKRHSGRCVAQRGDQRVALAAQLRRGGRAITSSAGRSRRTRDELVEHRAGHVDGHPQRRPAGRSPGPRPGSSRSAGRPSTACSCRRRRAPGRAGRTTATGGGISAGVERAGPRRTRR